MLGPRKARQLELRFSTYEHALLCVRVVCLAVLLWWLQRLPFSNVAGRLGVAYLACCFYASSVLHQSLHACMQILKSLSILPYFMHTCQKTQHSLA